MRVVLTGASGQLGGYLRGRLLTAGYAVSAWSGIETGERMGQALRQVDLADAAETDHALSDCDPALVIHAAAIASAERVRRDPRHAAAVNVAATGRLAEWCARRGRQLIFTSTDMVFDGSKSWWNEHDVPNPLSEYGRTKVQAEGIVRQVPGSLTVRLSLLFGPTRRGRPAFFDQTMSALRRGETQTFFRDEFRTPLALSTAAEAIVGLIGKHATGLVHVGGQERMSRFEFARRAAGALGFAPELVQGNFQREVPAVEPRPADVSLDTTRLREWLPDLRRLGVEDSVRESVA